MCIFDALAPPDLFCETQRQARVPHQCGECGRRIARGERYTYASGLQDGRFWAAKQCAHCAVAAALLVQHCGGFVYGCVCEDLDDHANQSVPWSTRAKRYAAGMRRRWRAFRRDGLMAVPGARGHLTN